MNKLITKLQAGALVLVGALFVGSTVLAPVAYAAEACNSAQGIKGAKGCTRGEGTPEHFVDEDNGIVNIIINTMLFIVGVLSVIMIIYGGILYTTAHGDKNQVDKAKNTLIYAIVGLIVAIIAYALVNWVTKIFMDK